MPFDLGSVNPWRDEDYWPREDAEIGSDRWIAAEIAAGRSGEEIDKLGEVVRRQQPSGMSLVATRSSRGGAKGACGRARSSLLPLLIWTTFFVFLALDVHV